MIIDEPTLLSYLKGKVFLFEPPYRRKYIPLGLAKIATYIKRNGGEVRYGRSYDGWGDVVCISSLFTYHSEIVHQAIDQSLFFQKPIILGGIYATLMSSALERKYPNLMIYRQNSQVLDLCVPDYTLPYEIDPKFDAYGYAFTTRGCPNDCPYCAVWRIEKPGILPNWKEHLSVGKLWLMLYDNNPGAFPEHTLEVLHFLQENNLAVEFNGGFDIKHLTPEMAKELGKTKYARRGMRLSFDRIQEDGLFQEKVKLLLENGVKKNSVFVYTLFNFNDTPKEADYRAHECVRLGVEPFPTFYIPLYKTDRRVEHIGKHWTKPLADCFRRFYMLAGYYTKWRFGDFIHTDLCKQPLSEEDFAAWEA